MNAQRDRIVLVGPRAVGKSTVGRALAERIGYAFVDADDALGERAGMPAGELLRARGERAFRELEESTVLELLAASERTVLALGGGAVLSAAIRAALAPPERFVVYLVAPLADLETRQRDDSVLRPPLTELPLRDEIEAVLAARGPLYDEVADVVVESVAGRIADCVDRILAASTR